MGQAKARGTKEQRVAQALANPKPKKLTRREEKELIHETVCKYISDVFETRRIRADIGVL